jgi:hypothetical protein
VIDLLVIAGVGVALLAFATAIKLQSAREVAANLAVIEVEFPADLTTDAVAALLTSVTGFLQPWWRRWLASPFVASEVISTNGKIRHVLVVPRSRMTRITTALRAHIPTARYRPVDVPRTRLDVGAEYGVSDPARPLMINPVDISRGLLGSLQPLRDSEGVVVQIVMTAHPPSPASGRPSPSMLWRRDHADRPTAEQEAARRKKMSRPMLSAVLRIGVRAESKARQRHLLRRVEANWHSSRAPGVHVYRRHLPGGLVAGRMERRSQPTFVWPASLNVDELTGLVGVPLAADHLVGVSVARSRRLALPTAIGENGTIIGDGWRNGRSCVAAVDLEARFRHLLVVGPTGAGKTTLTKHMVLADVDRGSAVLVIDPAADLVNELLASIPRRHWPRVVVLDAADERYPIGINPLRLGGTASELSVEHLLSIMRRIYAANWGVRTDDWLRAALRSLIHDPDATLLDVIPMLTDVSFRQHVIDRVTDPFLLNQWKSFNALSTAEAAQHVAPVVNKIRAVAGRPSLRRIFGQPRPAFDLGQSLNSGGIVLVPLSSGTIGHEAANLFGAILLGVTWNVIQGRASVPPAQRRPLMLHLDEFARYSALPVPFDELLAQARKCRAGVTMAAQHLHQLPPDLRHAVLANPRSRLAFQTGADDARLLAHEFGPPVVPADVQWLGPFEVLAQLFAQGHTQPPATLTMRPAPPGEHDPSELRELSRRRWGADGNAVDAAIEERLTAASKPPPTTGGPTGRRRRQP